MTLNVSYPGVYLSETATSTISIQNGQTIVPLFVIGNGSFPTKMPMSSDGMCFYNFKEVCEYGYHTGYLYYRSLSGWFDCGGGKCYLAQLKDIENVAKKMDEINLIVSAGYCSNPNYNYGVGTQAELITIANNLADSGKPIFTLLDGPRSEITSSDTQDHIMNNAGFSPTPHAAAFYPWCQTPFLKDIQPIVGGLAPSVVAALAIAKTDRTRGVWKAPCNVPVSGITPGYSVTDTIQGMFNQGMALNMIRTFPETGTVLWGARTLEDSDNWRYIPVRRLFDMVENNIKTALGKLVFEPNSQPTWQRAKAAVDNYIDSLWQQGALMGNKPAEAWFIEIGKDVTMTDDDINQGKMIMKIGLAAVRPAEFIILQFTQDLGQ